MSPMPEYIYKHSNTEALFYIHARWELKWVIWPQRCEITGRRLWPGTRAYQGRSTYKTHVNDPWTREMQSVTETRWHDRTEHIMWQLKE
jgi:hypothetical protein